MAAISAMSAIENRSVYTDLGSLQSIAARGRENSEEGLKEVAKQFESLFINMMLKSVRETNGSLFEGNYLQSSEMDFHQENLDNQLSLHLSEAGGFGLADVLYRQMAGQYSALNSSSGAAIQAPVSGREIKARESVDSATAFSHPENFVQTLQGEANAAGEALGVAPEFLLAQSALETGWGRSIPVMPDGSSSHNLFGIKADDSWSGKRVTVNTLEYEEGVMKRQQASFRAYDSFADSFSDYMDFLRSNPRYHNALEQTHDSSRFAEQLQEAGYATDPDYASKIDAVMQSPALRNDNRWVQ